MARWALWSDLDGSYAHAPRPVRRLPANAELSGDGRWATVYRERTAGEEPVPVAVYVRRLDGVRKGRRGGIR